MSSCFRCNLVRSRLLAIPEQPGRWGNFLASVVAACWAATLWLPGPSIGQLAAVQAIINLCSLHLAALWMTAVAVVPILGMLSGSVKLRVLGASLGLVTWSTLILEMIFQGTAPGPTISGCLVGLLGCLNADLHLARLVAMGQE